MIIDETESIETTEFMEEIKLKLATQSVGDGYFHFLFAVLYAVYIMFAAMHCHQNRFKLCIPCTDIHGNRLQFHSKRFSLIVAYQLLIIMATINGVFNLYLYESTQIANELLFCYFSSLSLCFGRTLLALWLFHSWIQFNFGTVHSR